MRPRQEKHDVKREKQGKGDRFYLKICMIIRPRTGEMGRDVELSTGEK